MNVCSRKSSFGKTLGKVFLGAILTFSIIRTPFAGFLDAPNSDMFVQSSKNIFIVKQSGSNLTTTASFANGARMSGDWILRSSTDRFGPAADFDGDGKNEIFVASSWGVGVTKPAGNTFTSFGLAQNNLFTSGGWKLNTFTNQFGPAADFNGDGRAEILFSSPWGIGVMYYSGGVLTANLMVQNETRISGLWLLDTKHDHLGPVGDFDGDGHPEFLISSPWGIAIMKYYGSAFASITVLTMVKNGTIFPGGWTLNTADNRFGPVGRFDGDGTRQGLFVSSSQGVGILKYSNGSLSAIASVNNGTRLGGGWVVSSTDNQFGPVGDFDGDKTMDELLFSSPWGIASVKLSGSTLFSSAMTQNGTRLNGGWVVDTKANRFGPVGNFDNGSQEEILATSPWGISFFKLSGDAFTSPVMAQNGSGFNNWKVNTVDNRFNINSTTFSDVSEWLANNPRIAGAIVFERMFGYAPQPTPYTQWTSSEQADLKNAFRNAELGQPIALADPPVNQWPENSPGDYTVLSPSDAWLLFCAHIGNSLNLEINQSLWWSLKDYNDNQLASIVNSTSFFKGYTFVWMNYLTGYIISMSGGTGGDNLGWALPSPPSVVKKFLTDNSMIGSSRSTTITNMLEWCRSNLTHFIGNIDFTVFQRVWQYRGVPPVSRMIAGTIDPDYNTAQKYHWTAGCWGTSGFLKNVLRTVNIPVDCISIPNTGHCTPFFSSENKYLSHGDDPYNKLCDGTPDISELLISADTYTSWFGPSVPGDICVKNVGRHPTELAVKYLPKYLLFWNCKDKESGRSHENSMVYDALKWPYTLSDLENMQLWIKLDAKTASLGGCSMIPSY
jgi:hypothetical protein